MSIRPVTNMTPASTRHCTTLLVPAFLAATSGCHKTPPITLSLQAGCNPFATSSECLYPFPSSAFQSNDPSSPTQVRVSYPTGIFGASTTGSVFDVTPFNTADGASPSTPILLHYGADVDLANLPSITNEAASMATDAPIALIDLETGLRVPYFAEMDENRNPSYPGRYAFIIRPVYPMVMGHRHVVVITDAVKLASGAALPVPPAFAALRDKTITTNAEVEQIRDRYETIFATVATLGYAREHISLAWDFMVASSDYIYSPILSMRTATLMEVGSGLPYVIQTVKSTSEGGELVEGTFEAPTFISSNQQFEWDANHLPVQQPTNSSFPFTMYIPSTALASDGPPLPLLIFGHGLFGTAVNMIDTDPTTGPIIRGMAEKAGVVLIGTDWIGLSGSSDDAEIGGMVATDLNNAGMVTERLTQSLINNLAMTKLIRGNLQQDPMVKPAGHDLIDLTHTYYYGVSLGGIQGSAFVPLSDDISRAVLAVPGCDWSTLFPRSVDWGTFAAIVDPIYPDPLQQLTLLSLLQARWDFDDGVNLALMLLRNPLPGTPAKTVLMQEAIGDSDVPNVVTEILARVIGVQEITPNYGNIFGISQGTFPTTSSSLSQYFLESNVEGDWPPETDVYPPTDNNVHFDMNLLPNVQEQIVTFLQQGQITQYCSSVCSPD